MDQFRVDIDIGGINALTETELVFSRHQRAQHLSMVSLWRQRLGYGNSERGLKMLSSIVFTEASG